MTGTTHTYRNTADFYASSDETAWVASKRIQVADPDNSSVDDTSDEGWFDLGYVAAFAASHNIETFDLATGTAIKTIKNVVKVGENLELPISVMYPSYQALTLNMGNTIAPTFTAPANGQDTVASSTDLRNTVITTGTNIAAGDLVKIVTGDTSTYGGYEELAWVQSYASGTKTVTHSELSQAPQAAATFLKVGGAGTAASGAGIKWTFGGTGLARRKVRIIYYGHPNKSMFFDVFTECKLSTTTYLDFAENGALTCTFMMKVLDQGNATNGPLFGYRYLKAYDSSS